MRKILFVLLLAAGCWNCQEDTLDTYSGLDNIYFTGSKDTTIFSFAFATNADTVVSLGVYVTGKMCDFDRTFNVRIASATGVEGVNYDPIDLVSCVIPANETSGALPLHLYRKGSEDTTFYIELELLPNPYFSLGMADRIVTASGVTDTISRVRQVIGFSSKIAKPTYLWEGLLYKTIGYYSEPKFIYISSELAIDPELWYSDFTNMQVLISARLVYLKNYLNSLIAADDWKSYPKDPENPNPEDKGYLSLRPSTTSPVIPNHWPHASEVIND